MADQLNIDIKELQRADSMPFEEAVLHAALCYVRAGIPVVPLESNSKKLPAEGGINYMSATTKEITIKKWFGEGGKYRGYNIGIGCGTKTGVGALDVDAKPVGGTTGLKELAKILDNEGPLPPGPRQRTPSGGYHYLYAWQDNFVSSSSKVANGLDTRGGTADRCTGHIVAYPSTINGKAYVWEEGGDVPLAPEWLSLSLGQPWKDKPKEKAEKQDVPIHQINRMLSVIDPDDLSYEDWVKVGMALKSTCGEDGLDLWDNWSLSGARRKNGECQSRWKSFNEDGEVGFGTLLFLAKEAGWRPLPGDVSNNSLSVEVEERVLEFNKRFALVQMGKTMAVAQFREGEIGFLSMTSFYDYTKPDKVMIPTKNGVGERQMSELWMASPRRRLYHRMGVWPMDDQPSDCLNLWKGWGVTPNPDAKCDLWLDHIKHIICDGNQQIYEWVLDWMADAVQNPRQLKGTAIILRGIEGCGKGAFADQFGKIFGDHYTHLIDSERLTGRFNQFLSDNILVFADEVLWPGDRKAANVLKGIVTESRITFESKGVDAVEMDNMNRVIIASNENWIVPAGPQSRRWLVLNVSPAVARNRTYFNKLFAEIEAGGMGGVLHMLQNRKITNDIRLAPTTRGLIEQRQMSHSHDSLLHFMSEAVLRGGFATMDMDAAMGESDRWPRKMLAFELYNEYITWCKERSVGNYDKLNMTVFMSAIGSYGFLVDGKVATVPLEESLNTFVKLKQGIE